MLRFLNAKIIIILVVICATIGTIYASYSKGYDNAKKKYQLLLTEFSAKAEKLRTIEKVVTKEIVIQYRDRISVVTEKETILLAATDEQLKQESLECKIGPNFIKLHNEAATR